MSETSAPVKACNRDALSQLLASAGLPYADLPEVPEHFFCLENADTPVAAVGLELFGDVALLRSLVVRESQRGAGLAGRLMDFIERYAARQGVRQLYLLTTTAEAYFLRRGYQPVDRQAVPDAIGASSEFASVCPSNAACLAKSLDVTGLSQTS